MSQGHEIKSTCLKQGNEMNDFCLKQRKGLKASAAHHHPNFLLSVPVPRFLHSFVFFSLELYKGLISLLFFVQQFIKRMKRSNN